MECECGECHDPRNRGLPPCVVGDRDRIDIVLANLVRNALTFTDPGGQMGLEREAIPGYVKVFVVDAASASPPTCLGASSTASIRSNRA